MSVKISNMTSFIKDRLNNNFNSVKNAMGKAVDKTMNTVKIANSKVREKILNVDAVKRMGSVSAKIKEYLLDTVVSRTKELFKHIKRDKFIPALLAGGLAVGIFAHSFELGAVFGAITMEDYLLYKLNLPKDVPAAIVFIGSFVVSAIFFAICYYLFPPLGLLFAILGLAELIVWAKNLTVEIVQELASTK